MLLINHTQHQNHLYLGENNNYHIQFAFSLFHFILALWQYLNF